MTPYEIPMSSAPQSFQISLLGVVYSLVVKFCWAANCWVMDINDINSVPVINGMTLVTGVDLLAQYSYLGIGGSLYVQSDFNLAAVPSFDNMGKTGHIYFVVP